MQVQETGAHIAAVTQAIAEASWYEVKLRCRPEDFYATLPFGQVMMFHHFYEPWHRDGAVARLLIADEHADEVLALLETCEAVAGVEPWQREQADCDLYGEFFGPAMLFFQTSSLLAPHPDGHRMTDKLVHCILNARGMGRKRELRFALKFAWMTATIEPRLWLRSLGTGKKWWHQ